MKVKKDKSIEVSYFSKIPLFNRNSILMFSLLFMTIIEIILLEQIENIGISIFLTLIVITLTTLFIKKWTISKIHFKKTPYKKLKKFIYDNKLYESEVREVGTLKNGNPKKKTIVYNSAYFSYRYTAEGELIIKALKKADKFSDKANTYDTMLSALLGLPIYKKIDEIQYCDYVFELIPDKRIQLGAFEGSNRKFQISLTSKIHWQIGHPPHVLIVGGTGSGKTYLVNYLVLELLNTGATFYIADPKASDLAILGKKVTPKHTAITEHEIAKLLREANEEMEYRYKTYFFDESSFGKTWRDIPELKPIVIVFDEYAAFTSMSNSKINKEVQSYLFNLILKGRQAGIEVIMLMQRPDANLLSGNIRDQFGIRIGLGNMTNDGRKMIFGTTDTVYKSIQEIGGGYILIDGQHIQPIYFESPFIGEEFNFLEEVTKIVSSKKLKLTLKKTEIERQTL